MKILTPPDFVIEMYAELSENEKKALQDSALNSGSRESQKVANQVTEMINERIRSLTGVEGEESRQWEMDMFSGCGIDL